MERDFTLDRIVGDFGQAVAAAYVSGRTGVYGVEDVSRDSRFIQRGIDLVWRVAQRWPFCDIVVYGEVKTDLKMYRTGNFFIETQSNTARGTPGWLTCSEADRLLYLSFGDKKLYDLDLPAVRRFLSGRRYPTARSSTGGVHGTVLYHTKGIVVPRDDLLASPVNGREVDVAGMMDTFAGETTQSS